jgi:hypothetical protein
MASHNMWWLAITKENHISTSAKIASVSLLLLLAGCSAPPSHAPIANESSTPPPVTEPALIDKALGEPAKIFFVDGQDAVTVTVESVQRNFVCTSTVGFALPSQKGEYVALTISVATSADYESLSGNQPMRLFYQDFYSVNEQGEPGEPDSAVGAGCIDEDQQLPLDIPAGEVSKGVMVLDVAPGTPSIAWMPSVFNLDNTEGWVWPLS